MLTDPDKIILLTIARQSIISAVLGKPMRQTEPIPPSLQSPGAAFVTVYKGGDLRGCIGYIVPSMPLHETVADVAAKAVLDDPRFFPVTKEELPDLSISISVLSPLRKIRSIDEIIVGTHGLMFQTSFTKGLLLPKVAVEYGWNREQFLDETARKAGLPRKAWRDPGVDIFIFTADEITEQHECEPQ